MSVAFMLKFTFVVVNGRCIWYVRVLHIL